MSRGIRFSAPPSFCPNQNKHTIAPDGYLAWHDWAEQKSKTHEQVQCQGCALWVIWEPKRKRAKA